MGLLGRNKNNSKPVVKQIIDLIPRSKLHAPISKKQAKDAINTGLTTN